MSTAERPQWMEMKPVPASVTPAITYRYAWRVYAWRRVVARFFVSASVPVCLAAFLLSRLWLHVPSVTVAVTLLWLAATYVAVWWAGEFRCPRCRRRFGALGSRKGLGVMWRGLFDKVCYNCKLRKFENS